MFFFKKQKLFLLSDEDGNTKVLFFFFLMKMIIRYLYITLTDFKLPRIDENLDLVDNFVTVKFQI